jgi:hypothetical protein
MTGLRRLVILMLIVLPITACATKNPYQPHYEGAAMWGYPACRGDNPDLWDSCVGVATDFSSEDMSGFRSVFIYRDGKRSDGPSRIVTMFRGERETCDKTTQNGQLVGWRVCRNEQNKITSRNYYVNGIEDPAAGAEIVRKLATQRSADQEAAYRQKCETIGFKTGTEKFADCVLRMMEINAAPKTQTVIQNTTTGTDPAVRALLEEQQRQRQLEGSLELMEKGLEMMQPPQSPTVRCTNNTATSTITCR